ncbi:MAG: response regulator [Ferruginibacter sp.]
MKNSKTFLIADDDPDDRELFIEALKEIDGSSICITASDGQDALRQLQDTLTIFPDFIFLDLNMPLLNGAECLAEIKKNKELGHIPVIIYSTSAEKRDIDYTSTLGAAYFLQKPNRFEDLRTALADILSRTWDGK